MKQVRFAYQNPIHSPPTPALSFNSSTSSSEPGPVTLHYPTQLLQVPFNYQTTTYSSPKQIRFPPYSEPIRCHPLLKSAGLTWDMFHHPSTAKYNYNRISHPVLSEPATTPSLPYMKISSRHLPWAIEVCASNGSFVSLEDVLDAIYHSLRTNITPSEFNSLPSSNYRRRATRAYEQRYRSQRSSTEYDEEKKGGMKRIDFLLEHTHFLGLANHPPHTEEWSLEIG